MLQFEHVSFSYRDAPVLQDVSFFVDAGERVGLIGANGAGKSTLMKTALGLLTCDGTITVDGVVVQPKNLPTVRQALGYVLQDSDNQLFMPTVLEDMIFGPINYGVPRAQAEERADAVLQQLGISHLKHRHNHSLSGGEKRLAAIATILTIEPKAMLMDEPSTALDPKNRRRLIHTLNAMRVTKLIASHDLDLVLETCDRVILLSHGQVVADGKAGEILRDKALLEANDLELPFCLTEPPK